MSTPNRGMTFYYAEFTPKGSGVSYFFIYDDKGALLDTAAYFKDREFVFKQLTAKYGINSLRHLDAVPRGLIYDISSYNKLAESVHTLHDALNDETQFNCPSSSEHPVRFYINRKVDGKSVGKAYEGVCWKDGLPAKISVNIIGTGFIQNYRSLDDFWQIEKLNHNDYEIVWLDNSPKSLAASRYVSEITKDLQALMTKQMKFTELISGKKS